MTTTMSVFVFWLIMYLVGSWLFAGFDRRSGKKWYRWLYNMTNQHPLPQGAEHGFVTGRTTSEQFSVAIFTSAIFTFLVLFFTDVDILSCFLLGAFGTGVMTFGFATATLVSNLWSRRDRVFEKVDDIQSGKINPMDAAAKAGGQALSRTKQLLRSLNLGGNSVETGATEEPPINDSQPSPVEEIPVIESPDDLMAPFLHKGERSQHNGESTSGL